MCLNLQTLGGDGLPAGVAVLGDGVGGDVAIQFKRGEGLAGGEGKGEVVVLGATAKGGDQVVGARGERGLWECFRRRRVDR